MSQEAHPATTGHPVDLDAIERHWAAVGNSACPQCQNEALVAELRAAREVVNQISVLLDTSPIGPTRADLAMLATQIRQVIDKAKGGL